jgi:hypothetical protein
VDVLPRNPYVRSKFQSCHDQFRGGHFDFRLGLPFADYSRSSGHGRHLDVLQARRVHRETGQSVEQTRFVTRKCRNREQFGRQQAVGGAEAGSARFQHRRLAATDALVRFA